MKRKTVTAFLMSLSLAMTIPGSVYASDVSSVTEEVQVQSVAEETPVPENTAEEKQADENNTGGTEEIKEKNSVSETEQEENTSPKEEKAKEVKKEEKKEKQTQTQSGEAENSVQEATEQITKAVEAAAEQEKPDMSSDEMKDFITAMQLYDTLSEADRQKLSEKTQQDMQKVQSRISDVIHTSEGITATSADWYAQTQTQEASQKDAVLKAAGELYPGCSPHIVYGRDIQYTNILTGKTYAQNTMISLTFPVPAGYDQLINPKVVSYADGKLTEISAQRKGDSFFIERARSLQNIYVIDTPIDLTGITMDAAVSVNAGQKQQLSVHTVPEKVTQAYQLTWSSDNTAVATVDAGGQVTALQEGTAHITATVVGTQISATCTVTVVQGAHALPVSVDSMLKETREYMLATDKNPTIGSEWFALGLARSGLDTGSSYFSTYYNHVANYLTQKQGKLTNTVKYTEYSKAIIVMTAIGKDARNIAGYNLFEPLADFETVKAQGTNGPIWALIALNCNPAYSIPEVSGVKTLTTEQGLIDYLLDKETPKGGWSMTGEAPDPDLTGMALQALAPYYQVKGYEKVTAAIDRALEVLSTLQKQDGGYATMGVETSESAAQVLTALCALGIDPMQDARFIKGGSWLVENLMSYHISGSGFMHVKAGAANNGGGAAGEVNGMATEQAYYALTAYQRLLDGKTSLYDMSDIRLTKGETGDGKGTGLEDKDREHEKETPEKNPQDTEKKKDDKKQDTEKKDDKKATTDKKKTTTTAAKKKLTYKGKRLKLTGGTSGKKLTLSGNSGKKLTLTGADGTTDGTDGGDGWAFAPEDYAEGEDTSEKKLTLSEISAVEETASPDSVVTESQDSADAAQAKESADTEENSRQMREKTSLWAVIGGAVLLAAAVIAGIFIYRKKKL